MPHHPSSCGSKYGAESLMSCCISPCEFPVGGAADEVLMPWPAAEMSCAEPAAEEALNFQCFAALEASAFGSDRLQGIRLEGGFFICFRWMVRLSTHLAVSGHSTARCENSWERFGVPGSPPSSALWPWDRNRRGKSPAAGYVPGMSGVRPDPVVRTALGYAVCGLVGTEGLPVIVRRRSRKSDCSNDQSA